MELASSLICSHLTMSGARCHNHSVGEVNLKSYCKVHRPGRKGQTKIPTSVLNRKIRMANANYHGGVGKLSYSREGLMKYKRIDP